MLLLDGFLHLRRHLNRSFLRTALAALALGLLAMVFSSLFALGRITRSVESLVGDSLVGVESAVTMRATVRETQLKLLRQAPPGSPRLTAAEIEGFAKSMAESLRVYRTGVFETEDEVNAERIESQLKLYLPALGQLAGQAQPEQAEIGAADALATELVYRIDHAYQFNRDRTHSNASDAAESARVALVVYKRVSWGFACMALAAILLYVFYRWVALPENTDA